MRPLERVTVIELSRGPACALAGLILAGLGADVIRIEPPGGKDADAGARHLAKSSVAVDLVHDEGRRVVRELAQRADALLEDHPPGALARQGLDYAVLSSLNPRLVFVSCHAAAEGGREPPEAGLWATAALVTALAGRARTGQGAWVECFSRGGEAWLRLGAPGITPAEAAGILSDPELRARGMVSSYDDPARGETKALALPLRFLGWDPPGLGRPPRHGEHTEQVLRERLGYSAERIAELRRAGAVGGMP